MDLSFAELERWYQEQVHQVMANNPTGESSYSSEDGSLGPSFYDLHRQHIPIEDECIDPALLQLAPQQPGEGGEPPAAIFDHAVDSRQVASIEDNTWDNPPLFLEIFEEFLRSAEEPAPVAEETNEQFFNRPEIRELVSVPDTPDIPEDNTSTPPAQTEAEEQQRQQASVYPSPPLYPAPVSPVPPASPLSLPSPPPVPCPLYTEASGVEVYRVERILQAWGPRGARQYLIRWEGWGPEFDSWEPAANVSADLVAGFEGSRRRRRLSFARMRRGARTWG